MNIVYSKKITKVATGIVMVGSACLASNIDQVNAENLNQIDCIDEYKNINKIKNNLKENKSVEDKLKYGWIKEGDNWYYYKDNYKATGWLKDGDSWYWLKSDGRMASNEWIKEDDEWYCFKSSGAMYSNEWVKHNGSWYWLKLSGKMSKNEWIKDNDEWYWLESDGKMSSDEWLKHNGSWYWLKSSGKMAKNEILKVNGDWYRFDSNGKMDSNKNFKVGKIQECDYLNIRTGASTSYTVIGKVYTNDYVEILDSSGGWNKIKSGNGTIGWASSSYIKTIYNGGSSNGSSTNETTSQSANSKKIETIIALAKKQLGKPYEWGAEGPNTFDCSGLTYYLYKQHGITLPRTSKAQATAGYQVSKSNLKPGDLVFFNTNGSGISHVGIYIGNGNMIHSTKPGDVVKTTNINSSYYASKYVTARRIID